MNTIIGEAADGRVTEFRKYWKKKAGNFPW
jgi:hypothetical protein